MYYMCPECKKIYEDYVEKCTECGRKIALSDSVSEDRLKDFKAEEDFEEKTELFRKRIRNGYISIPIYIILCGGIGIGIAALKLSPGGTAIAAIIALVVVIISYGVLIFKCHLWACPYCDLPLSRRSVLGAYHCAHCGKRIR